MWSDSIKMSPWKKAEVEKKRRQIAAKKDISMIHVLHVLHVIYVLHDTWPTTSVTRIQNSLQPVERKVLDDIFFFFWNMKYDIDQNIDFSTILCDALRWKLGRHNSCWIARRLFWGFESAPWGGGLLQLIQRKQSIKYHCFDGKLNLRCAERCKIRGAQLLFSLLWEALNVLCGGSQVPAQLFASYAMHTIQATKDQGPKLEVGNNYFWSKNLRPRFLQYPRLLSV